MTVASYSDACRILQGLTDKNLGRALVYGQGLLELRQEGDTSYRIFREAAEQLAWHWAPWSVLPRTVRVGIAAKWNSLQDCASVLDLTVLGERRVIRLYLTYLAEITPTRITPEVLANAKLPILAVLRANLPYPDALLGQVLNGLLNSSPSSEDSP